MFVYISNIAVSISLFYQQFIGFIPFNTDNLQFIGTDYCIVS